MKILLVGHDEVSSLLPMSDCIEVMEEVFKSQARGEVLQPLRQVMPIPDSRGVLALMPSYITSLKAAGVKVITAFPENLGTGYDSHQGAVMLFEGQNGRLLSIMDATSVTATRTAAVSAVATRSLARSDAGVLAILGSGTQAVTHLESIREVRSIKKTRVWSRNPDHAKQFSKRESKRWKLPVEVTSSARDAVKGADIICTVTSASSPILFGEWIEPGVHINAVGASRPPSRELDSAVVVKSKVFVDRRESAANEAEDLIAPKREGRINENHILGELGDVLIGKVRGRTSVPDITLFKSLGLAIQDLASAHHIYSKALAQKKGKWIEFTGQRGTLT
jgi:ornithine cyclodeaminase